MVWGVTSRQRCANTRECNAEVAIFVALVAAFIMPILGSFQMTKRRVIVFGVHLLSRFCGGAASSVCVIAHRPSQRLRNATSVFFWTANIFTFSYVTWAVLSSR
jgi:energy-converting hydrogenase Eha subunit G